MLKSLKKYDLEEMSICILDNIHDILDHFNLEYQDFENMIAMPCPIHDGDNPNGLSIFKRGVGNWKCFTHQCHEKYGNSNGASIIQFIQALLDTTFAETLKWCADFLKLEKQEYNKEEATQTDFIHLCKYINRKKNSTPIFTPRDLVKTFLKIPADYYIERGYTEEILHKFDIGYCFNQNKPFFDRIITPFYDADGKYMIGCSGRNKYERCEKCKMFHQPNTRCPITKEEILRASKWKHSSNFSVDSYLYNYWNAKQYIEDSYTVILVEGPGDIWRLEEAGIHNGLALLGSSLSNNQKIILEESGAVNLVIATDNDDAGNKAYRSISENCKNLFNIKRIEYPGHDPGSLTVKQVKNIFLPIIERM